MSWLSMRRYRRVFVGLMMGVVAGVGLSAPDPAEAGKAKVFTGRTSGVAIGGYDPVAYFALKKPVRGKSSLTEDYAGVKWRFSSEENRKLFAANPEKYAPQYGGYCAYAVSQGYTAKSDPTAWTIEGDRLFLNYNKQVRQLWSAGKAKYIKDADKNWPGVLN